MSVGSARSSGRKMSSLCYRHRHKRLHEALVTPNGKSFGEEIRENVGSGQPGYEEVALTNAISNPVIPHIDTFGATDFDCIICQADCTTIVGEQNSWRLGVMQSRANRAAPFSPLGNGEDGPVFSFGGGGNYDVENRTMGEYSTVRNVRVTTRAEVCKTPRDAARAGTGQVGRIGLHLENHVTSMKDKGIVRVTGTVSKKTITLCKQQRIGIRQFRGDGGDGWQKGAVDNTSIPQKTTNNFLDTNNFCCCELGLIR